MASTPEQKNEGSIASRLRSSFKKTFQTKEKEEVEDKRSQLRKGINKIKAEMITKKSSDSLNELPSKEDKKDNNPTSSKQLPSIKPIKQQQYYIRWEGIEIENTPPPPICDLCKHDLTYKEEQEHSVQDGEDQLQQFLLRREEDLSNTILPEVAVLPCSHVFHCTCLSALPLTHVTDPSCPVCVNVTMPL